VLGPRIATGLEHLVYLRKILGVVLKRPWIAFLWQPTTADVVREDIMLFHKYGIFPLPTMVYERPLVKFATGRIAKVAYLGVQPFVPNAVEVTVADMVSNLEIRDAVYDIVLKAEMLTTDHPDRGVDYLGGANWIDALKALSPFNSSFQGKFRNLLILQEDLYAQSDIGNILKKGDLIGRRNDVVLIDVRLFNSGIGKGLFARIKGIPAYLATQIEYGAVWELMRFLGIEDIPQPTTFWRKVGHFLGRFGVPKIQKYLANTQE
jgi:hypothetical protein